MMHSLRLVKAGAPCALPLGKQAIALHYLLYVQ